MKIPGGHLFLAETIKLLRFLHFSVSPPAEDPDHSEKRSSWSRMSSRSPYFSVSCFLENVADPS